MDRIKRIGIISAGLMAAGITGLLSIIGLVPVILILIYIIKGIAGAGFFTTQKAQQVVYTSVDAASVPPATTDYTPTYYTPATTSHSGTDLIGNLTAHIFSNLVVEIIIGIFILMIIGFIIGALIAIIYNIVAKFTGGIEAELEHYEQVKTTLANPTTVNVYSRQNERDYRRDIYSRPNERVYRTNDDYQMDDQYFSR
ncbi:hypothetical protein [Methanomicrobium mobile]|uniref:hypothetical protein n=1 Tax=Methanomicrobium mobile TaxID=2205 RepID=UPI0005B2AACC|nr:hypothetical protein [Methanomicrobium mobile]